MRKNIFMRSVMRQPGRTLLLALLILAAAFAFVARVVEYVIVNDEINRIEGLYNAVGNLVPVNPQNITQSHNVAAAADVLVQSPLVAYDDRRVFAQGVLHGMTNVASQHFDRNVMFFPNLAGLDINNNHFFYATPRITRVSPSLLRGMGNNTLRITMDVDEILAGDPNVIRDGNTQFETRGGDPVNLTSRRDFRILLTDREADLFEQGLFDPLYGIVLGQTYLFRGFAALEEGFLRPLYGNDGFSTISGWNLDEDIREDNLVFFVSREEAEASAQIQYDIAVARENISSMMVTGVRDMTTVPRFANRSSARLLDSPRIDGGRWLTYEDYENANHVAVLPVAMATRRGMRVGDTFTITLRSNSQPAWMDEPTSSHWATGGEGWWASTPQGWWATTGHTPYWQSYETYELTLEVVGLYWNTPVGMAHHNFLTTEMYIPASVFPEGFGWDGAPLLTGMYNFVLNSPRDEAVFRAAYEAQMRALGFRINFMPNGFDAFAASADPIRTSIMINVSIFAVVSVLILSLVIFLYLKQWRKAVAVSRALGTPASKALLQLFSPVFAIWTPAIVLGALGAWFFALSQASGTLEALDGANTTVSLDIIWLILTTGIIIVFTFAVLIISGIIQTSRPVLEQLQGTVQKRKFVSNKTIDPGDVPPMGIINISTEPLKTTGAGARSAALRHILRHISRTPAKSVLVAVVALFFVVSLGWLNHTIIFTEQEIDRLWDETIVQAEIVRIPEEEASISWLFEASPISPFVLSQFLTSGFIQDAYVEAFWPFSHLISDADRAALQIPEGAWFGWGSDNMAGVSNLQSFIELHTRTALDDALGVPGESIEMFLIEGFNAEDFIFGGTDAYVPVIVNEWFMQSRENDALGRGDHYLGQMLNINNFPVPARIVGVFNYGLPHGIMASGAYIIMPLEALEYHVYGLHIFEDFSWWITDELTYATVSVSLNPARNRNLDDLRDFMYAPMMSNVLNETFSVLSNIPLELIIHDQELRNIIEPMERNLELLRILYPIAIGVAAVLSIGLALLVMLQNAKNAAIMRVLGKPKAKSQIVLCAEQILVCILGVFAGLVVLVLIGVSVLEIAPLSLAMLYFAGAIIGSAVGALVIAAKTPLELLQVRE
ncbi:MAG: ABC transporter permease [Defluviitaleaceae bacterium]|nr:ABC transporter permease [Defluviitaleaceae bacterium]